MRRSQFTLVVVTLAWCLCLTVWSVAIHPSGPPASSALQQLQTAPNSSKQLQAAHLNTEGHLAIVRTLQADTLDPRTQTSIKQVQGTVQGTWRRRRGLWSGAGRPTPKSYSPRLGGQSLHGSRTAPLLLAADHKRAADNKLPEFQSSSPPQILSSRDNHKAAPGPLDPALSKLPPLAQILGAEAVAAAEKHATALRRGEQLDPQPSTSPFRRFDFLGPDVINCPEMQPYGDGDEAKMLCAINELSKLNRGRCDVISFGSNGQWRFEEAVYARTNCTVHTFDCTGDFEPPEHIASRVHFYKQCLGGGSHAADYRNYTDLLAIAGVLRAPAVVKMDIEGFEWAALPTILQTPELHPQQIAVEIHYNPSWVPPELLGWRQPKTEQDHKQLSNLLAQMGYFKAHRRDNTDPDAPEGCCTEILYVKMTNRFSGLTPAVASRLASQSVSRYMGLQQRSQRVTEDQVKAFEAHDKIGNVPQWKSSSQILKDHEARVHANKRIQ